MAVLEDITVFFMASYNDILHYACRYMDLPVTWSTPKKYYPNDELDARSDPIFILSLVPNINEDIFAKNFMDEFAL